MQQSSTHWYLGVSDPLPKLKCTLYQPCLPLLTHEDYSSPEAIFSLFVTHLTIICDFVLICFKWNIIFSFVETGQVSIDTVGLFWLKCSWIPSLHAASYRLFINLLKYTVQSTQLLCLSLLPLCNMPNLLESFLFRP